MRRIAGAGLMAPAGRNELRAESREPIAANATTTRDVVESGAA